MKKIITATFVLFHVVAVAQVQLTNVNGGTVSHSSNPRDFVVFDNTLFFVAQHDEKGREVWKTNGTAGGTILLKDINIGVESSVTSNFLEFKGKLYFVANDGINGHQLWVTDGSEAGTRRVTSKMNYPVNKIVSNGDYIFYLKNPRDYRLEVWKSDGTDSGTTLVKGDIAIRNTPDGLISAVGLVFFAAENEGSNGTMLWRTDGTEGGTFTVAGPLSGNGAGPGGTSGLTQFIEYNGALYLIVRTSFANWLSVGLMKTDGTVAGTERVVGMYDGNTKLVEFADVIVHNDKMYFSFFDLDLNHFFIFESKGLADNTKRSYEYSGPSYFAPSSPVGMGEQLYFTSGNSAGGTSLIKMSTTTLAAQEVKELSGPISKPFFFYKESDSNRLLNDGEGIFIRSRMDNYKAELWRSDGTTDGTSPLGRVLYAENLSLFQNTLFFSGAGDADRELWKSDGTVTGTVLVRDINAAKSGGGFGQPRLVSDGIVLPGSHPDYGTEIWVSDGTSSGTRVVDLIPGKGGAWPYGYLNTGDKVYFFGLAEAGGISLYATDATTVVTQVVRHFTTGDHRYRLAYAGGDNIFAFAAKADGSFSLYVLNKVTGAGDEIKNFGVNEYGVPFSISEVAVMNDLVYFLCAAALWKSDGTTEGTVKVADFHETANLTVAGNYVYFTEKADYQTGEVELYKSDGTPEGTGIVKNLNGSASGNPADLIAFKNKLLFTASDQATGKEVWITDGTEVNTVLLKDINAGGSSGISHPQFVLHDGMLFFMANSPAYGAELWKTDGTDTGTVRVRDIVPGPDSSKPASISNLGGTLYFAAFTPAAGYEIWTSDGTDEGTRLVVDVVPGPRYSNPRNMVTIADQLVFTADTESTGTQLWSYKESVTSVFPEVDDLVSVYPNPSSGIFNIAIKEMAGGSVTVLNSRGSCVFSDVNLTENAQLNVSHLPSGLYVMKITKGRKMIAVKVLKK